MKHSPTDRARVIQDFENTARDNSEKVDGIRDLIATGKAGFAKMWAEDTGLGEKTINRGLGRRVLVKEESECRVRTLHSRP